LAAAFYPWDKFFASGIGDNSYTKSSSEGVYPVKWRIATFPQITYALL
jgi:hypothetical protein